MEVLASVASHREKNQRHKILKKKKRFGVFLVPQMLKCLPAVWETQVRSLGWGDHLEKEMATHSNTLAWKIPWTEEPGRLQSMGSQSWT